MSQIKTVTTVSGENEVTFDAFYAYVWFKNVGDTDVYVAPYSGFSAGDVDVSACPAGQMVRITAHKEKVYILGASTLEIHAQNFSDCPFKVRAKGGEQITVTPLSVSENGTYTAPTGSAYSPVTVDIQEQPWEPLEDGYSNFWFELTDDTLSPWLNFSAKNADAVIDWGDGSGEVALDTLTPTHTYSKAGKYVVKVKGVTGIARQLENISIDYGYFKALKAVELSTEIATVQVIGFGQCKGLEACKIWNDNMTLGNSAFNYCVNLYRINLPANLTSLSMGLFQVCALLNEITLPNGLTEIGASSLREIFADSIVVPATVNNIGSYAFMTASKLSTIHMQPTTPPTLGTNVFANLPSNYIIYVPTGTGDTYKAAWSAYADHIVEEGQSLSKAALRRIQAAEKSIDESEVR